MPRDIEIKVQELNETEFRPYGKIIAPKQNQSPDFTGKDWQCWYPLGELPSDRPLFIGLVRSEPGNMTVTEMEKHPTRSEWVFALEHPIVQTVALSSTETPNRPDPQTAMAFLLNPGQGVLISNDVWHAAGLAPNESILYGFVLAKPTKSDEEVEEGMVPFHDGTTIAIEMQ